MSGAIEFGRQKEFVGTYGFAPDLIGLERLEPILLVRATGGNHGTVVQRRDVLAIQTERPLVRKLGQSGFALTPEQISIIHPSLSVLRIRGELLANFSERIGTSIRSAVRRYAR